MRSRRCSSAPRPASPRSMIRRRTGSRRIRRRRPSSTMVGSAPPGHWSGARRAAGHRRLRRRRIALAGQRRRLGVRRLRNRRHIADARLVVSQCTHLDGVGALGLRQTVLEPQRARQIGDGKAGLAQLAEDEAAVVEGARHLCARQTATHGSLEGAQRLLVLAGAVSLDAGIECLLNQRGRLALLVTGGFGRLFLLLL